MSLIPLFPWNGSKPQEKRYKVFRRFLNRQIIIRSFTITQFQNANSFYLAKTVLAPLSGEGTLQCSVHKNETESCGDFLWPGIRSNGAKKSSVHQICAQGWPGWFCGRQVLPRLGKRRGNCHLCQLPLMGNEPPKGIDHHCERWLESWVREVQMKGGFDEPLAQKGWS